METLLSVTADRGVIRQSESGRRDSSSADKSLYWDVHPGDVVYNTMRMWQGVSGVAQEGGIVSPAYTVCEPVGDVSSGFLRWLLKEPRLVTKFLNLSQGLVSDTWNLKYSDFKKIEISLPSFIEQQRIAEVLNEIDRQVDHLCNVAKKKESVNGGIVSRLMVAGQGWAQMAIGELGDVVTGRTPLAYVDDFSRGVSFVTPSEVTDGGCVIEPSRAADPEVDGVVPIPAGATLVVCIGFGIGKVGFLDFDACVNQQINALVPHDFMDQEFVSYLLGSIARELKARAGLQVTPIINKRDFSRISVRVPPLVEQREISRRIAHLRDDVDVIRREVRKMELAKRALMDDLLVGKLPAATAE
ncbi:restriction endonuclease subunit S [Streptomyces flaveolus]|uniref:restriction endonuclease subunit S n=1 Tax=Streptomyces flaveolus TaxID=67297 RepID=UPI0033B93132